MFQDVRVADYGKAYSTKRTVFKFSREKDRSLFSLTKSFDRVTWGPNKFGKGTLGGVNVQDFGDIGIESTPLKLNLREYSGIVVRLLGDGKPYRVVVRTGVYYETGVQFEVEIATQPNKWQTHRLPFSSFEEYKGSNRVDGTAQEVELDRSDVRQFGVLYRRAPADPSIFIVSLDYIKVRSGLASTLAGQDRYSPGPPPHFPTHLLSSIGHKWSLSLSTLAVPLSPHPKFQHHLSSVRSSLSSWKRSLPTRTGMHWLRAA
jgi:hypothetical protein